LPAGHTYTDRCGQAGITHRHYEGVPVPQPGTVDQHGVRIRGREIVIDRKEQLEAFARPQRLIDDPTS
jgi:hypothetical protein